MHHEKLQAVRLRRQPRAILGPRRRIGKGHDEIEADRVVNLPFADPFHRLIVLHQTQMELPRQRIIAESNGLLEDSFDVPPPAGLPDRHDAGMFGRREARNVFLRNEDPRRGLSVAIEEMLAQSADVFTGRLCGNSLAGARGGKKSQADRHFKTGFLAQTATTVKKHPTSTHLGDLDSQPLTRNWAKGDTFRAW
jgi:hypothetical protein